MKCDIDDFAPPATPACDVSSAQAGDTPTITLTGTVQRLYASSETFAAGTFHVQGTPGRDSITIRAPFDLRERERYSLRGSWVHHPKYGRQFDATAQVYTADLTAAGLQHFLTSNPKFFGIGPKRASALAALGDHFEETLLTDLPEIMRVGGLTATQATTLRDEWSAGADRNALFTWLSTYELTPCQMNRLYEHYGAHTRDVLEGDPYTLCREVRGYGFARTDVIALRTGVAKDAPARLRACVSDILASLGDEGHCYIEAPDALRAVLERCALDTEAQREAAKTVITEMCESADVARERVGGKWLLADPHVHAAELAIFQALEFARDRDHLNPIALPVERVQGVLDDFMPDLNDAQADAVRMALDATICAIVGEAGTGKSFTIAALHTAHRCLEHEVMLLAPTGKAAKRMLEMMTQDDPNCKIDAATIHRGLGYNPFGGTERWTYCADNKLPADVVIVDEAGMLSAELAWRLFDAIDFTKTQLVLVGDPNQLQPVGAGNVLLDVLAQEYCPTVKLTQVVRQAGVLKQNCVAVLHGDMPDTAPGKPGSPRPWYVLKTKTPEDVLATLLQVVEFELPKIGMGELEHFVILVPQHNTPIGVKALNLHLQRLWQRLRYGVELPEVEFAEVKNARSAFFVGDRIMNVHNNYDLNVMNGAQGIVTALDAPCTAKREDGDDQGERTGTGIAVDFGTPSAPEVVTFPKKNQKDLTIAYAMSVHKSQGSEYPVSIVICSRAHSYMLSRSLIYTAVTRARRTCIIIGDSVAMHRAVNTDKCAQRRTWLSVWKEL